MKYDEATGGYFQEGKPPSPFEHQTSVAVVDMTLRDYFAATALQAFIAGPSFSPDDEAMIAKVAYEVADAMLKERNK